LLPALYAVTLFVGATLLFLVQPLVGKLLLPLVGGTPGVWNTCMVFFQAVLLAGYLYAHRSTTQLGVRRQVVVHLGLLVAVVLSFKLALTNHGSPMPVDGSLIPADQDYPLVGVIALLATAVGIPFFVLSTTSPLLQKWFTATGHPSARDPYFLYAASNAGSLLGLIGYPLLIEPKMTLSDQQEVWAVGVGAYLALVVACALTVFRHPARVAEPVAMGERARPVAAPQAPLRTGRILRWVGLSALPSSLLLGVTTQVSSEVAPIPLLWVIPLALYLVSFIVVFSRWPDRAHRSVGRLTPVLLLLVVVSLVAGAGEPVWLVGSLHLAAFFCVCLVCHGELAKDRPPPEHLTRFYFWMSLGGVLGGLANALIAPMVFQRVGMIEYPLALALAAVVRPRVLDAPRRPLLRVTDLGSVVVLFALAVTLVRFVPQAVALPSGAEAGDWLARAGLVFGLPALFALVLVRRRVRFALALGAILVASVFNSNQLGQTLHMERNFFGVVRVTTSPDGRFVRLVHGSTLLGQRKVIDPGRPLPLTFYHPTGPVGRLFRMLPSDRVHTVGVIGLGTGAVASYARPGERWVFYEIDPAVARLANDPRYFDYLQTCRAASCQVILGDARRQLTRSEDGEFDVLVLDAFNGDSVPVHLLTREAMRLYVEKLAPGGVIVVRVPDGHLDLPQLVARLAVDHDPPLYVRCCHDVPTEMERTDGKLESRWMVIARREDDLLPLLAADLKSTGEEQWHAVRPDRGPIWRDDFANLLLVWKRSDEH
jgi:hypothetical protein